MKTILSIHTSLPQKKKKKKKEKCFTFNQKRGWGELYINFNFVMPNTAEGE